MFTEFLREVLIALILLLLAKLAALRFWRRLWQWLANGSQRWQHRLITKVLLEATLHKPAAAARHLAIATPGLILWIIACIALFSPYNSYRLAKQMEGNAAALDQGIKSAKTALDLQLIKASTDATPKEESGENSLTQTLDVTAKQANQSIQELRQAQIEALHEQWATLNRQKSELLKDASTNRRDVISNGIIATLITSYAIYYLLGVTFTRTIANPLTIEIDRSLSWLALVATHDERKLLGKLHLQVADPTSLRAFVNEVLQLSKVHDLPPIGVLEEWRVKDNVIAEMNNSEIAPQQIRGDG